MNQDPLILLKDSLKYACSKAIPGLMGFVSVIAFVRMIGIEEYGKYSIQFSFLMAISSLAIHWLNSSTLRYYSKYQSSAVLPKIFVISVPASIVFGLVVLGIVTWSEFLDRSSELTSAISFYLFIALCVFQFLSDLFRAQLKPNNVIIITIIQSILGLIIPVAFFKILGLNYKFLLLGLAISYSIPPIIFFLGNIQHIKKIFTRGNYQHKFKPVIISFLLYGSPMSLWLALSMMLSFLDRFFIEYYFAYSITGIYASFSDILIRGFSITLFPITMAVHPRIMSAWNKNNQSKAIAIWRKALKYQIGIFIVLMGTVSIFTGQIFTLIMIAFPELDITYSYLLMPILTGSFLWQFALLCHKALEMDQRTSLMVVLMLAALCVNLIGNIVYLPHYGIIATAYTYMASAVVYIITVIYFSRHKFLLALSSS